MKKILKKMNIDIPHPKKNREDAPALLLEKNELICLAVFDGLGGAGSVHVLDSDSLKTKAYIASRLARFMINLCFEKSINISEFIKYLNHFHSYYETKTTQYQITTPKTLLKGSMLKEFPTTIAGIVANLNTEEMHIFWLGDSRVYGIYEKQIVPLSKDHSIETDPFYISSNAKLTQCLQAYQCPKLAIRNISDLHKQYQYGHLLGVFVCTDGLYNAFENIFTFYEFMLQIIINNLSKSQIENHLKSMILNDDLSMSLVLFDNITIDQLKLLLKKQNMKTSLNEQNEGHENEMKKKHLQMINFFINLTYKITNHQCQEWLQKSYRFISESTKCSFDDKKLSIQCLQSLYHYTCTRIEYLKSLDQILNELSILYDYYDQLILNTSTNHNHIQKYEEYKKRYLRHLFDV